ncbi:MAG: type II toxin-antitoxin system VapC family toxin [Gammaproteobacteria bacterium]|nr:type II toxin-antitoxin system VapC family toxin [Gammaproteobacteria bacterium]MCY4270058.1 type II toxin-antitoxin system VapC family toxin [Gammaproteobacteria bacterium]MCY4295910.1 type II toxin-antitoxin system VapC family toxin [Gammaproteobacteria bacterium]
MRYMLDTNILIYLLKNKPASVTKRVNAIQPEDQLCMSFVTYAELLKGAERSDRKDRVLHSLEQLIRQVPVLYDANQALCQHYAQQSTRLKSAGTPIGANDLWIACHALAEDTVLVTHNTREYMRIDGLRVEDWTR